MLLFFVLLNFIAKFKFFKICMGYSIIIGGAFLVTIKIWLPPVPTLAELLCRGRLPSTTSSAV